MKCWTCHRADVEDSLTTYYAKTDNCYVIIENVPCRKCTECGAIEYSLNVLEKVEKIVKAVEKMAAKVMILDYEKAA